MSLEKLKRTLHREFTRNPAKSFTLLALLPVAGYFIGPLVWKQLPMAKESPDNSQMAQSFVAPQATAAVATGPGTPGLPRWQDVAEWIERDVRMQPSVSAGTRDPFQSVSKVEAPQDNDELVVQPPPPSAASLRPEDCGLELTATIIGQMRRLATISGRLYAENARVPFGDANRPANDAPPNDHAFVLKTVNKNFVVLERHGELFQLPLARGADK